MEHLERREGMHMNVRHSSLDGRDNVQISRPGIAGVYAALQADLRGAARICFANPVCDLLEVQVIRGATQRTRGAPLCKRAKSASIAADVRVIDVSIDDITD